MVCQERRYSSERNVGKRRAKWNALAKRYFGQVQAMAITRRANVLRAGLSSNENTYHRLAEPAEETH